MKQINYEMNVVWEKTNALYARIAMQLKIGYPELMVLYALVAMGEQTQKQIADRNGMQKQTVNTVVRRLRERGYVELLSQTKDKREKLVVLTASGREYGERVILPVLEAEDRVYQKIGLERSRQAMETQEQFNLLMEKEMERGFYHEEQK